MQYQDFDLEIGPGVGRKYPVSVRSAVGQTHGTMLFPYDEVLLEKALLKLEKALLQSGGVRRRAMTEQEQAVQDFSRTLFDALVSPSSTGSKSSVKTRGTPRDHLAAIHDY